MWARRHVTDLRNDLKSNRKPKPNVFREVIVGLYAKHLELCCGKWLEKDKMGPPDPWGLQERSPNAVADWEVTVTWGSDGLTALQEGRNRQH